MDTHGTDATPETCVVCGLATEGDDVWCMDDHLPVHPQCYRIAVEMLFSGRYDRLTGEELRALMKMRALKVER